MKSKLKKIAAYIPIPSLVFIAVAIFSAIIHVISLISVPFADFFNLRIASAFRFLLAKITGVIPFSLAEILIILLPIWLFLIVFFAVRLIKADKVKQIRFLASLFATLSFFYSSFVFTFATAYRGTPLEEKLSLQREKLTADDISFALTAVTTELFKLADGMEYAESGLSVQPYDFSELNKKLNTAYKTAAGKYEFLNGFGSNVKEILLSEPMTYTHISGVYTFFTGEANVNVNYPDYVIPFTVAHEMAHQRGIAREDEANFVAFLVCLESEDNYIKYSAYFNIFEYLFSSLCRADIEKARAFADTLPGGIKGEINGYSAFFEKYSDNVAADISDKINDAYLITQGQTAGVRSYGLVTELAVAYYKALQP